MATTASPLNGVRRLTVIRRGRVQRAGSELHDWVHKSIEEHAKGKTVVLALPHYVFPSIVAPLWALSPEVRGGACQWVNPKGKRSGRRFMYFLFILRADGAKGDRQEGSP